MGERSVIRQMAMRWRSFRSKGFVFHPSATTGWYFIDTPSFAKRALLTSGALVISGWSVAKDGRGGDFVLKLGKRFIAPEIVRRVDVPPTLAKVIDASEDAGFRFHFPAPFGLHLIAIGRVEEGQFKSARRLISVRLLPLCIGRLLSHRTANLGSHKDSRLRYSIDAPSANQLLVLVIDRLLVKGWAVSLETGKAVSPHISIDGKAHPPHAKKRQDVQKSLASLAVVPEETGFELICNLSVGFHTLEVGLTEDSGSMVRVFRRHVFKLPSNRPVVRKRNYETWVAIEQKVYEREREEFLTHIQAMVQRPTFSIKVLPGPTHLMDMTQRSLSQQIYPPTDIELVKQAPFDFKRGAQFVVTVAAGDVLNPAALYHFADASNREPSADLIYADEDTLSKGQRILPFFKPQWSPDYLENFNYLGSPVAIRRSLIEHLETDSLYDLILKATERTQEIVHLDKVLCHRHESVLRDPPSAELAALQGRLARTGRIGEVAPRSKTGGYDITLKLSRKPLVSVVIPTAGKVATIDGRSIDLIISCVEQLRHKTAYEALQIIVVHNGDIPAARMRQLKSLHCKLIFYSDPIFNIARKLNLGAKAASGRLLLLMNDDIEVLSADWLDRMVQHFEKPHVGVVGAKLLYTDGRTQHVGVVHNSGNPDHVRRLFPANEDGYFHSTSGVRNFMAVTGACMLTPTALYRAVGGYTEALAVSYNDADYCMKVASLGRSIVYEPQATLIHFESVSREAFMDIGEANFYQERWAAEVISDGFYNERFLTVASPTFEPSVNPRLI